MLAKSFLLFGILIGGLATTIMAQDTSRRKTINITSTFKPVLRDAVKINFNAAPPTIDTARPKLNYSIPNQYLFLNYQPSALNPVALQVDSLLAWQNDNYIKVGIGNVHQPYLKAGFSFGDGKTTFFNAFADGYAAKGSMPYQKNDLAAVSLAGTVRTKNNLEWNGKLGFKNEGYYLYGFQPDTLKYDKSVLRQRFQTFDGKIGLRNMKPTEFGLTYNPSLQVDVFSDNHTPKASEANTVLILPLQKDFGKQFAFGLGFTANLTNYRLNESSTMNNNYYLVSPALTYRNNNLNLHLEATPSWDNKNFHLLPNFTADLTTDDQRFTFQAGWIGYYEKGSYQRFESINPWLAQPTLLLTTRVQEFYGGFKGSLSNHISYSAKVGFAEYWNMPLFVNDSIDGKTFVIRYDHLQDFKIHGEITYTQSEQFNVTAGLTINQYLNIKNGQKAWGLIPMEFTTTLRWQLLKDLWLKGDLLAFDGAAYLDKDGSSHTGDRGFDLNAGVEFRITRQLNLWFQMNNIFNNKYERWHQYPVYGFNVLGGVIFSFAQK
ncbi:MAG: hypothetical protein C5B59_01525 [Bacteroidetes bacterium]|nr:MAG: hypothetical protein C5B59_01525 [Bacteroidota bacterium]